jgi:hypothetical protein
MSGAGGSTHRGGQNLPLRIPRTDHRRAVRVLHLEPVPRRARPVGCGEPLRHDALKADLAGVVDERRPFGHACDDHSRQYQ